MKASLKQFFLSAISMYLICVQSGCRSKPAAAVFKNYKVEIGDIVFIRINNYLYRRVASATKSWTSHVGVVVEAQDGKIIVAESKVPLSRKTPLDEFIERSEGGKYSIKRLAHLTPEQKKKIIIASDKRMGKFYHFGFNYDSRRQFCSKFVYEVFKEATGTEIGELVTFRKLLDKNPNTPQWFWRIWFLGFVPWERRTITPASQYECSKLITVQEKL